MPSLPIRRNGRLWKEDGPAARAGNETLRATRHHGRAFWKRRTGYHARSRGEAKMRCLEAFGDRIAAFAIVAGTIGAAWLTPDRQTAELHIRIALTNRFHAIGTAEIVRAARRQWAKGHSRPKRKFRNMYNRPMRKRVFEADLGAPSGADMYPAS